MAAHEACAQPDRQCSYSGGHSAEVHDMSSIWCWQLYINLNPVCRKSAKLLSDFSYERFTALLFIVLLLSPMAVCRVIFH